MLVTHSHTHAADKPAPEATPQTSTAPPVELNIKNVMDALQSQDMPLFLAATATLEQWIEREPGHALALMGLGISLARRQQWLQAQTRFEQAIAAEPKLAQAHSNLGNLHRQFGRRAEAIAAYKKAVQLQPGLSEAHYNLSIVLDEEGKPQAAEEAVRRALLFRPNYPEAHNNLGNLLLKGGKVEAAVSHFRQALVWNDVLRPARFNLIIGLYRLGRSTEAQAEVDRLLKEHPDDPQILRVQAAGLAQQGALGEAERINQQLLKLQPDAPDLWLHQGEVLLARKDFDGAMALYKDLLSKRNLPPALAIGAMAQVMLARGNYGEARHLYQQALMMDGRLPALLMGLARTLLESGDTRLGLETLRRVLEIAPAAADIHSLLIHHMRLDPTTTAQQLQDEVVRWNTQHSPQTTPARPQAVNRKSGDALRVGFIVGDVEQGPVADSLLALLDRANESLLPFIYQATAAGPTAQKIKDKATHWRPAAALGATDLAEQIRQDGIDVVIDTLGHGPGSRLKTLALRPAPVQLCWLGDDANPGIVGIDACLLDAVQQDHADESDINNAPAWLTTPFVWTAPTDAPDITPRGQDAVVFGVVSPLARLNSLVLDHVAQVLIGCPHARLHVLTDVDAQDEVTLQKIRRLLALREVEPERIDIHPALNTAQRQAQLGRIDIVLDAHPGTLGQAALECLWMGAAVVSLSGPQSWQRASTSVLTQLGLQEWVAQDAAAYVATALAAADNPDQRATFRAGVRERIQRAPVMNAQVFADDFAAALLRAWDTYAQAN